MKKSNKSLSLSAFILMLAGLLFTSSNVAFAAEEKAAEDAAKEVATEAGGEKKDGDKKKKKEGKDGEEPECE